MSFEPKYATLADLFQTSIDAYGPRELFGTKKNGRWTWTTYAEFGNLVAKLRGGLASLGIGRGDNIACVANNRVEWAVAAYAAYGLGAAFVPMYEAQPDKDWEFMVKDSEKYASTGGWGFGRFIDGKPVDAAQHKTCFACHEAGVKGHDYVFTRLAY